MKKITFNKTYKAVEAIVPPLFLKALKSSPLYQKISDTARRNLGQDFHPSWHKIKSGPLKGRELYMDDIYDWQKEMISGHYDQYFSDFIEKHDPTGKIIFDIGAHIGYSTLYFAEMVEPPGKVVSFEPNNVNLERIQKLLSRNSELGKRVTVVNKAVSDRDGHVDFVSSSSIEDGSSSGGFIEEAHTIFEKDSYEEKRGFRRKQVETVSIDSFVGNNAWAVPYMIKIDIEGAEFLALKGAMDTLRRHKPILLMEIHSIFNMLKVCEMLDSLNYKIVLLKEETDGRCFISAQHNPNGR